MVCDAILKDKKVLIPSCVYLDGDTIKRYLHRVPAVIGKNGVEKIEQIPLTEQEQELFAKVQKR
jgi:malate/lactate dehydrogenase